MEIVVVLVVFCGLVVWGASRKSNTRPRATKKPNGLKSGYHSAPAKKKSKSQAAQIQIYHTVPARKKRFPQSPQSQNRPKFPKNMEIKGRAYIIDGDTISIAGTKIGFVAKFQNMGQPTNCGR